jgi:hypothetical protein
MMQTLAIIAAVAATGVVLYLLLKPKAEDKTIPMADRGAVKVNAAPGDALPAPKSPMIDQRFRLTSPAIASLLATGGSL